VTRSFRPRPGRARPRGGRFTWRHGVAALGLAALVLGAGGPARAGQADESALDEAVAAFWAATSDDEVAAATAAILATDPDIEAIWARLRAGRSYAADVPTGRRLLTRRNRDGLEHGYVVRVPERYDPAIRYPVIVYLHGGVARPKREDGTWWRREERLARDDAIVVAPASWNESLWWQDSQIENLAGVLDDLKRTWNLDENRAYLIGISDGATGAFYHAMKATTPWAAFLALNGHPVVLANPASDVDGEMHVTNLRNKPLFVINGGRDRLYPTASVVPFMRLFQQAGVFLDFRPQPDAGHDVSWWDDEKPAMDAFMTDQVRRPLPARLSWETERTDRYNRAHWLVITELGTVEGEPDLEAYNTVVDTTSGMPLGINMIGQMVDGSGLRVLEVGPDSMASAAGMIDDDTIVEVDGTSGPSVEDLRQALVGFAPGQVIPLVVQRGAERIEIAFAYPADAAPRGRQAFPRAGEPGRVELDQRGNTVTAYTRGVRRFTLLISPEQFDFTQPITVVVNGVTAFDGMVEPDIAALLRWVATDRDRTAMYGAEVDIVVPAAR
jgi:predicted esterase